MDVKKQKRQQETDKRALVREGLPEPELLFDIDKNRLDDEWLNQPKRYFEWAVQLEDARADIDDAKREYDVTKTEFDEVKAKVELDIRNDPDDYHLPKVTDKSIAAVVLMQLDYKEAEDSLYKAQERIDTAKHRAGILQAVVSALDQRKKALEKLVDLHGQKYFATPRASENSAEVVDGMTKRAIRRRTRVRK